MKSHNRLAAGWDKKQRCLPGDYIAAVEFVGTAKPTETASDAGIAHCLRAWEYQKVLAPHSGTLAISFLKRHGLDRPALRMATACLIALDADVSPATNIEAAHIVADFLENPANARAVTHSAKFDCEVAASRALGPFTRRGLRAAWASLGTIISDNNDGRAIPLARKLKQIEFLQDMVPDSRMQMKALEVGSELEHRGRHDANRPGVFFPQAQAAAVELERDIPVLPAFEPLQLADFRKPALPAAPCPP